MLVNVGQACLKPAILLAVDGPGFEALKIAMIARVEAVHARTMRTPGIHQAYRKNVDRMRQAGAAQIARGPSGESAWDGQSLLFEVSGAPMFGEPSLSDEVFGPSATTCSLHVPHGEWGMSGPAGYTLRQTIQINSQ
ncbi:hypothetical protein [Caballeronia sp. RCC_10]|uniref:hypothetical protein n=1 Tax=Caballeronia sp. RCC_10 TaxID=3239227 RepID=UPI00352675B4